MKQYIQTNLSKILVGGILVVVFSFILGPSIYASFTILNQSDGYGYGYGTDGYGYGFGYGYGYAANCSLVSVGTAPFFSTRIGNKIYVGDIGSSDISVVDAETNSVIATVPVGAGPRSGTVSGTNLYVNNFSSDTISVIDTTTNIVTATIAVGSNPFNSTLVGTDLYVNIGANDGFPRIDVIDTNPSSTTFNQKIATINNEGSNSVLSGTNLYVQNLGATVSVVDTNTKTITAVLSLGESSNEFPHDAPILAGGNLYLISPQNNNVLVVDTNSYDLNFNKVIATIPVGTRPLFEILIGKYLYVNNANSNDVSVIDTTNNSVISTIPVGSSPYFATLVGKYLYVDNTGGNSVAVVSVSPDDSNFNKVIATIPVGYQPFSSVFVGQYLYVNNTGSNTLSIIDTTTNTPRACSNNFVLSRTLTYYADAGSHGIVTGTNNTPVMITGGVIEGVTDGSNSTPVTAVPDAGYQFSGWSDGSTQNPRIDTNITNDITVKALFTALPPSLGNGGSAPVLVSVISNSGLSSSNGSSGGGNSGVVGCISNVQYSPITGQKCPVLFKSFLFKKNLRKGMDTDDVQRLQIFLNTHGAPIASSGSGSPGNEVTTFGQKTFLALIKYQKSNSIKPASGFFGPVTMKFVNAVLQAGK